MNSASACGLLLALTFSLSACVTPDASSASDRIAYLQSVLTTPNPERVIVVAHRGCWRTAPENSVASIEECIDLGVEMVEIDVRRTADGILVLMHDETVDRTTNGSGRVDQLTFSELADFNLREGAGGPDAAVTKERVPTFREAMLAAQGDLLVNLDAKAELYNDAFAVLEETNTTGHILMKRRVDAQTLPLTSIPPFDQVYAMPILDESVGAAGPLIDSQSNGDPVAIEFLFTTLPYAEEAAALTADRGLRVWVNTLRPQFSAGLIDAEAVKDPDSVWGKFLDMGFDIIQTDEPEALLRYIESRTSTAD